MGAYLSLSCEVLAFTAFAMLAAVVPYVNRKRNYWTSRGVRAASGPRALANTLPGVRIDDRSLTDRYADASASDAALMGLHDGGRPCALTCDVRTAAAALANDGFADLENYGPSFVPFTVDAQGMIAVLPAMTECVVELITSLESRANRQITVEPWTEVRRCAAAVVATSVYGQPMIHSRVEAFERQCMRALSGGRRPVATDYFATYDLTTDCRSPTSTDFKRLLLETAADKTDSGT